MKDFARDITNEQVGLLILNEIVKKLEIIEEEIKNIKSDPAVSVTENKVYRLKEVLEILDIGESKARQLLKTGELKSFKVGWEYRIPQSAIEEYMKGVV